MKIYTIARTTPIQKLNMDIVLTEEMVTLPPARQGECYPFQIYIKEKTGMITEIRFTDLMGKDGDVLPG